MRKTQIALAAVALVASTAVLAEGVTVYGNLDVGVGSTKSGTTSQGTKLQTSGGFIAGNNWGLKGATDLGSGLSAGFVLQQGINLDGNSDNGGNGTLFNQVAAVNLGSADVGTLTLGQQLSPWVAGLAGNMHGNGHFFVNRLIMGQPGTFDAAAGPALRAGGCYKLDKTSETADTVSAGGCGLGMQDGGFFQRNAITYTSPAIAGFTGSLMQTLRQGSDNQTGGTQATSVTGDAYTAANIGGSIGDIGLNVVYHSRSQTFSGTGLGVTVPVAGLTLKGTYISQKALHTNGSDTDGKVGSWSLGASYPLTDATTVAVQYASNDAKSTTVSGQSLTGLHLQHKLSKTTSVYGTYTRGTNGAQSDYSNRGSGSGLGTATNTTYVVGITQSF